MQLYSFWRSLASFRVRIALKFKRKDFDIVSTDLLAGDQFKSDFNLINPQAMVPSLVLDDGSILHQSMALLEYLDEVYPDPPLMPKNAMAVLSSTALRRFWNSSGSSPSLVASSKIVTGMWHTMPVISL